MCIVVYKGCFEDTSKSPWHNKKKARCLTTIRMLAFTFSLIIIGFVLFITKDIQSFSSLRGIFNTSNQIDLDPYADPDLYIIQTSSVYSEEYTINRLKKDNGYDNKFPSDINIHFIDINLWNTILPIEKLNNIFFNIIKDHHNNPYIDYSNPDYTLPLYSINDRK